MTRLFTCLPCAKSMASSVNLTGPVNGPFLNVSLPGRPLSTLPDEGEIIDDSEPEREALRLQLRESRRKAKLGRSRSRSDPRNVEVNGKSGGTADTFNVTDLASPCEPCIFLSSTGHAQEGFTKDFELDPSIDTSHDNTSSTLPSIGGLMVAVGIRNTDELAVDVSGSASSSQASPRAPPLRSKLSHHAFKSGTGPARGTNPPRSSVSIPKPKSSRSVSTLLPSCPISEADLRKIVKCVCCEVPWTVRKSSQTKWEHILKCAKKNDFTMETVLVRLKQDLETPGSSAVKKAKKAALKKQPEEAVKDFEAHEALFQGLNHEAGPSKKAKKQARADTVQSVADAHQGILETARLVLEGQAGPSILRGSNPDTYPPSLDARSRSINPPSIAPLQHVLNSAADAIRVQPTEYDVSAWPAPATHEDPGPFQDCPPSTQAFAPSRLGGAFRKPLTDSNLSATYLAPSRTPLTDILDSSVLQRDKNASSVTSTTHHDIPLSKSVPLPAIHLSEYLTNSINDLQIQTTLEEHESDAALHRRLTPVVSEVGPEGFGEDGSEVMHMDRDWPDAEQNMEEEEGWEHEDWGNNAVLQWEGDGVDDIPAQQVPPDMAQNKETALERLEETRKAAPKRKPKAKASDTVPITQPETPGVPTRKRAKKAVKGDEDGLNTVDDDEGVEQRLRAMIEEDEELYLRILRYEPLRFDDLLDKAIATGLPERKLKSRLRTFLDKQCINFYSSEPTGSRRRY